VPSSQQVAVPGAYEQQVPVLEQHDWAQHLPPQQMLPTGQHRLLSQRIPQYVALQQTSPEPQQNPPQS
jgi:hypothetical protein